MEISERIEALEKRIAELEDVEAVREVVARYGFNADLGLDEAYVDNFVAGGEYDTGGEGYYRGHDELLAFISDPEGLHKKHVEGRGSQHTSVNLVVRVNGDTAWAEGYSIVFIREGDQRNYGIFTAGYNHWDFRKEDGRWRIVKRRRVDIGEPQRSPEGVWGGEVMSEFQKVQAVS